MSEIYRSLYEDFDDVKCDDCIYYKMFGKTCLGVSNIIKWCSNPYLIVQDIKHAEIVAIIDINNRTLIRFKSNKHLTTISKSAKLKMSPKIYHISI